MKNKNISKTEALSEEKITKLILRYSVTTFSALFFSAVYNLVDTLFVSHGVGDNAMGGVSIILPFMMIQAAIAQTVGGGAASLVSRYLGKKEYAKAGEVTLNAMAAFYSSALVVSAIGLIFIEPILSALGATEDILPYAIEYFVIILVGNVFSTGFSSIIRAEGHMSYALLIWLIPTAVNIILDAVFILGFDMGVRGAAAATVLCQFTSFIMCIVFFSKVSSQNFKATRLLFRIIVEIISIGVPTLVQMGSLSLLTLMLNNLLSTTGGTPAVNSFAYINKIITFGILPFTALTQALSPIIGYNFASKNITRVKEAMITAVKFSLIYSVIALICTQFFSKLLIGIFTSSSELLSMGEYGLRIIAFALPFVPLPLLAGSFFQAIGCKMRSLILNALILVFMAISAFILSSLNGVNGIWWAFLPACSSASITAALIFRFYIKSSHI